jgi:hypothetical protein
MFNLRDTVRKISTGQTGTVEQIRDAEPKYYVQFGSDFADREWCKEDELELISEPPKPRSDPGFNPTRGLMDP